MTQRVDDPFLVGKRARRIAARDHQRAHAVGLGRVEDLVGEHRRRQLPHEQSDAAGGAVPALPRAVRCERLRPQLAPTAEHAASRVPVALTRVPTADDVQRLREMLGDVGVWPHVRPGARLGHSARRLSEHTRRVDDERGVDAGDALGDVERDAVHGGTQRVDAVDPTFAELGIVPSLVEDHAQHRREQRGVGPRNQLQVEVGVRGHLAPARVDDDQPQTTRPRFLEPSHRVVHREAGEVTALERDERVRPREQPHVAVLEPLTPAAPLPEPRLRDPFRGLVDRHRRIAVVRPDRAQPRARERVRQRCGVALRADEQRDRLRPVLVEDAAQPRRDLVDRLGRRDGREPVGSVALRGEEPVGRVVKVAEVTALRAREPAREWVVGIPGDARDAPVLDVDEHTAQWRADPAERDVPARGHDAVAPHRSQ